MRINPPDYLETLKHLVTGQSVKLAHRDCSESRAMSVRMDVDGYHFKCFKCGGWAVLKHEDSTFRDRKKREAEKAAYLRERQRAGFNLPADFGHNIEGAGLAWLGTGGWTADLIMRHGVGWSGFLSRVVFKVQPLGYTARAVHADQVPKYLSKAPTLAWWVSEPIVDRCCVTEDILSAGRVGQLYPAMAALGTDSFNWDILSRCKQVLVWTDNDKAGAKARRTIHDFLQWTPGVQVLDIESSKDPKKYTNAELRERLLKGEPVYRVEPLMQIFQDRFNQECDSMCFCIADQDSHQVVFYVGGESYGKAWYSRIKSQGLVQALESALEQTRKEVRHFRGIQNNAPADEEARQL